MAMARLVHLASTVLDGLIGVVFAAVIAITLVQVAIRYLIGGALAWSEELNLVLWVWMIQLGAIKTAHMRIEVVADSLPAPARAVVTVVLALIAVAILALLTWGGLRMMDLTRFDHYIAMRWLSVKYSYLALVVAAPLWMLVLIGDTALALRGQRRAAPGHAAPQP
jgi:TRAP-type C4-dicarboxylate transport system permease small subunit